VESKSQSRMFKFFFFFFCPQHTLNSLVPIEDHLLFLSQPSRTRYTHYGLVRYVAAPSTDNVQCKAFMTSLPNQTQAMPALPYPMQEVAHAFTVWQVGSLNQRQALARCPANHSLPPASCLLPLN
jgi:hypothetical protein